MKFQKKADFLGAFVPFDESIHGAQEQPEIEDVFNQEEMDFIRPLLETAVSRLSPVQERVIRMHCEDGLTISQISRDLDVDVSSVSIAASNGFERLRRMQEVRDIARIRRHGRGILPAMFAALLWPFRSKAMATATIATATSLGLGLWWGTKDSEPIEAQAETPTTRHATSRQVPIAEEDPNREIHELDPTTGVERVEVWRQGKIFSVYEHKPGLASVDDWPWHYHGESIEYWPSGQIRKAAFYRNGALSGIWLRFNEQGEVDRAKIYDQGKYLRKATKEETHARRMRLHHSTRGPNNR